VHALLARRVDGLIVVGNQTDPRPSPVAESRPPLTSSDMNLTALGRLAAERLSPAINGERHTGIESLSLGWWSVAHQWRAHNLKEMP
jgi:DNA-binding LacI/PurR family transcriptional regulator